MVFFISQEWKAEESDNQYIVYADLWAGFPKDRKKVQDAALPEFGLIKKERKYTIINKKRFNTRLIV